MTRVLLCLFAGLITSISLSQTYWVHSATVTHAGGWPSVTIDTRTPPFFMHGYRWVVTALGSQASPGGLQSDGVHGIVDATYYLTGIGTLYGTSSFNQSHTMEREDITITFKIRSSHTSAPPAAGAPTFEVRCTSGADVDPVSSPRYNHAIAISYYIPPAGGVVLDLISEAERPGGLEGEDADEDHQSEIGSAPGSWTQVSTNLWEVEVTVPIPDIADDPDQDLHVFGEASSPSGGTVVTAQTSASAAYYYRCVSLGGITLQPGF